MQKIVLTKFLVEIEHIGIWLSIWYWIVAHCPKLKINSKKLSKWQFHFPGLLEGLLMQKKENNFLANLDFEDNPIYLFWDANGQAG